ncbi:hypothetical protein EXIGLDRAFT_830750 [Exidia glandulosa HHB12029]|uniref:DUF6533 domain-containing protein n=1 Tax=Exidia glandulosa HHB12029 TaxID=1314781 RepID=A0A165N7M0_EXIGL|nr:hypothetical protein EXIGLDRAFT_830750 [Exidia glandulosa HHB12029]
MDKLLDRAALAGLNDVEVTKYIGISAAALCIYDFLLNLGDEVELLWTRSIRFGHILYLLVRSAVHLSHSLSRNAASKNRYLSSLGLIMTVAFLVSPPKTQTFCHIWPYLLLVQFGSSTLLVQTVLVARICAIYKSSKIIRVLAVTGCIIVVLETVGVGVVIIVVKGWARLTVPGTSVDICIPSHGGAPPSWRYVYWIFPILYNTFLFALVVCRAWLDLAFHDKRSIIRVIILDSSLTYLWNLILQMVSIFIWRYASGGLSETPAMMGNALDVALATRLLLNIWKRFYARQDPSLSTIPRSVDIVFVRPQKSGVQDGPSLDA